MASAIVAGFRLEEHYATRDAAVPELAAWAGLEAPVLVPIARPGRLPRRTRRRLMQRSCRRCRR